jgi:hypothetical protein
MPDYSALALTAQRLVQDAGRQITLVKVGKVSANTNKPWLGPSQSVEANPDATISAYGVAVDPGSGLGAFSRDEDMLKKFDRIYIVASTADFDGYEAILDTNVTWRIDAMEKLAPGPTILLYYFGVSRLGGSRL